MAAFLLLPTGSDLTLADVEAWAARARALGATASSPVHCGEPPLASESNDALALSVPVTVSRTILPGDAPDESEPAGDADGDSRGRRDGARRKATDRRSRKSAEASADRANVASAAKVADPTDASGVSNRQGGPSSPDGDSDRQGDSNSSAEDPNRVGGPNSPDGDSNRQGGRTSDGDPKREGKPRGDAAEDAGGAGSDAAGDTDNAPPASESTPVVKPPGFAVFTSGT